VEPASIKIAGDQLNESVVKYMRRKHNLLIGERTAEEMKKKIGCVFPKEEEETMDVKGRCLLTGLPRVVTVSSVEMMDAFEEPVERIMEAIHSVLERTPPELVADISTNGIIMTGGGSLVSGFDKLVGRTVRRKRTNLGYILITPPLSADKQQLAQRLRGEGSSLCVLTGEGVAA
jgi:rod shape-determining protein MreB